MAQTQYPAVMQEIKKQLKRSKVSYARLAGLLDIPESTLKKWFTAKDGSFGRITQLCDVLGIQVHALIKAVEEQRVLTLSFSTAQQNLFSKDLNSFKVYWLLVYERMDEENIRKVTGLKLNEYKALLYKLDKVNLIQVGKEDKVKVPKMKPVRWNFEGPFMEKLLAQWSSRLHSDAMEKKTFSRLILQFFQLSPESAAEFKKDMEALEEKYARRTILELSTYPGQRKQIRYLCTTAEGSFIE